MKLRNLINIKKYKNYHKFKSIKTFKQWQQDNPEGTFDQYYVYRVTEKLKIRDGDHPTLTLASTIKNDETSGESIFRFLIEHGLKSHHRVVDYGCGSLRVGRHLIPFLEPRSYYGLDVTDTFYSAGLVQIDSQIVAKRQPQLDLVDGNLVDQLQEDPPDYIFSVGVLIHIPPEELSDFISKITLLMSDKTAFILGTQIAKETDSTIHRNEVTWFHNKEQIESILAENNLIATDIKSGRELEEAKGVRVFWKIVKQLQLEEQPIN
ncbi:class I SAM-dependent methyltransferase [Planctomycetota bacterium]|nr:class I SAM-dependent methyltransferase [Planctomycetota bacterium]